MSADLLAVAALRRSANRPVSAPGCCVELHSKKPTAPLSTTAEGNAAVLSFPHSAALLDSCPHLLTHVCEHVPLSRVIKWIRLNSMQIILCANDEQMVTLFVTFPPLVPSCEKRVKDANMCESSLLGFCRGNRVLVSVMQNKAVLVAMN